MDIDAGPKVMGDDGEFHATDEAVDLSHTPVEAWAALALFWALGATVFYQFFTRYALNDSASWTEEIARYLLIGVVFVGASIGVAKNNHIQVDLLYRYLPARAGARAGHCWSTCCASAFFCSMTVFTVQMMLKMGNYQMTIVDLPMNIVYSVCCSASRRCRCARSGSCACTGSAATACSSGPSRTWTDRTR